MYSSVYFFHLLLLTFFIDCSPIFVLAFTFLCLFIFTLISFYTSGFPLQVIFFFCLSFFFPPLQSMLHLLLPYFHDNFQITCLITPFCEEVTVGSKDNSFTFLKTTENYPKGGRILFGFFLFKEVADIRSSKRDANGKV